MYHSDWLANCRVSLQHQILKMVHPMHKLHKFLSDIILGHVPMMLDENHCNEKENGIKWVKFNSFYNLLVGLCPCNKYICIMCVCVCLCVFMDNLVLRGSRGSIILRLSAVLFTKSPHKLCSIEMHVLLSPVQLTGTFPNSGMSAAFVMRSPGKWYQTSTHSPAHPIRFSRTSWTAVMKEVIRESPIGHRTTSHQPKSLHRRNAIRCQR